MSAAPAYDLLGHKVARLRGTVHLFVQTAEGSGTLRLTPADAQLVGRELASAAVAPAGERAELARPPVNHAAAAARGLPLKKPGGGL